MYHDTIVANGITSYSLEALNRDFDNAIWATASALGFGGNILNNTKKQRDAAEEGSEERKQAEAIIEALSTNVKMLGERIMKALELRPNAWSPTG